ncbi:protein of unknown function [Methylocella tundrae]|uniref:Uncharacterized protein n=1 Tax=Methylocella tundrae TaxID=227605 RepID=A0A4U8Z081_METTU|nr:protein of unknown function [Methylocella tundrae]
MQKEGPPDRTALPLSHRGARCLITLGGENLKGASPGPGPQHETMRHWITSFRYVEDERNIAAKKRFANGAFCLPGNIC